MQVFNALLMEVGLPTERALRVQVVELEYRHEHVRILLLRMEVLIVRESSRSCDTGIQCPVDCVWSSWGSCSSSSGCGVGSQSRSRIGPFFWTADCVGASTRSCNTGITCPPSPSPSPSPQPVDGVWRERIFLHWHWCLLIRFSIWVPVQDVYTSPEWRKRLSRIKVQKLYSLLYFSFTFTYHLHLFR